MIRSFSLGELAYLLWATQWTLALAGIAFIGGGFMGLAVMVARIHPSRIVAAGASLYVEFFQSTPLLSQLFVFYFGFGLFGINVSAWTAAGAALTLNTGAFLGEIWRGSLQSIPKAQWEASASLALTFLQQIRYVILPQALRISIPPTVGYLVQVIKSTSLASVIGFIELTRAAQIVNQATFQPFLVYLCVGAIYFSLCYPLTRLSRRLEAKLHVGAR